MIPPKGATDCHMHVLGPFARFPLAAERAYNVAEASLEDHERMKTRVGLERTVFVQASGHGFDNGAMLAALASLGPRARGVAVVPPDADLAQLHAKGVRGVRLNFLTLGSRHGADRAKVVRDYARLLAPLGWHLQVFADAQTLLSMSNSILECQVPVVIDHMGLPDAAKGVDQPGFQAVLRLAAENHVWVKLAGADRITRTSGRLRDAVPYMRALAQVAPERLVWGSDWPHIGFHSGTQVHGAEVLPFRAVDAAELLGVLAEAIPDTAAQRAILVGNPAKLYNFPREESGA